MYLYMVLPEYSLYSFTFLLPLLFQDSVSDMVGALGGILQHKNESLLTMTANVALKLVSTLPSSVLQAHVIDLVQPLSSLLSSHQLQASVSCATALNVILSNLSTKREKEVWEILKEREIVSLIVTSMQEFSDGSKPTECFQEMASLLSTILMRWPTSRCRVWSDAKFMNMIEAACTKLDFCDKVTVLKVYSALGIRFLW